MLQKVGSPHTVTTPAASETITGLTAQTGLGVAENERQGSEIPAELVGRTLSPSLRPLAPPNARRRKPPFYALRNYPPSLRTNFAPATRRTMPGQVPCCLADNPTKETKLTKEPPTAADRAGHLSFFSSLSSGRSGRKPSLAGPAGGWLRLHPGHAVFPQQDHGALDLRSASVPLEQFADLRPSEPVLSGFV